MDKPRCLCVHETTKLRRGGLARFTAGFSDRCRPAMGRLGARLFEHWRGRPFGSNRPETTTILAAMPEHPLKGEPA